MTSTMISVNIGMGHAWGPNIAAADGSGSELVSRPSVHPRRIPVHQYLTTLGVVQNAPEDGLVVVHTLQRLQVVPPMPL